MVILPGRRTRFGGNDSYTKLLLHFDGDDESVIIPDSSPAAHGNALIAGDAQLDTAQYVFGNSSLLLDGTDDCIGYSDSDDWYFGTGDFTVDLWVRFNALPAQGLYETFCSQWESSVPDNYWTLSIYGGADSTYSLRMYFVDDNDSKASYHTDYASFNAGQWYHVAFVRSGATGYIFVDGVKQTVTETLAFGTTDVGNVTGPLYIGAFATPTPIRRLNGWIDEFRISKGIARWTENFAPPTIAYR